jgi:hypothetical protein
LPERTKNNKYRAEDVRSNYNGLLHLALEIVKAHIIVDSTPQNKKLLSDLNYIKEHTSSKLNTPYFIVVHTIARNMHRPLTFPIEVKTGQRATREFDLGDLIQELENAHIRINEIQQEIAQNYSIDIPISSQGQAVVFDFSNPTAGMNERFKYDK